MPYFIKKPIPIEAVQQTAPFKTQTLEGELEGDSTQRLKAWASVS